MADQPPTARLPLVLFILVIVSLIYVFIGSYRARSGSILAITQKLDPRITNSFMPSKHVDDLEKALAGASTRFKTVILTIVNKAYIEGDYNKAMLDIFLDSFWLGENTRPLVNHLLIVAVDQTAYERCNFHRLHCYKLKTDGVDFDGEKMYMSDDFIKMMWQRTRFLGDVLKRGYNFIFTDTDVLWLRDPFPRLNLNESIDLQISVDKFNGDQWSENDQLINTGFYMIKSNNKTIALFDEWYSRKDNSTGMKEQDVLLELMSQGAFKRLDLRVRFLDTIFFSGICEDSRDVRAVVTVHANCCRSIKAKEQDLQSIMHDWQRFKCSAIDSTLQFAWSNHSACLDSWMR